MKINGKKINEWDSMHMRLGNKNCSCEMHIEFRRMEEWKRTVFTT